MNINTLFDLNAEMLRRANANRRAAGSLPLENKAAYAELWAKCEAYCEASELINALIDVEIQRRKAQHTEQSRPEVVQ